MSMILNSVLKVEDKSPIEMKESVKRVLSYCNRLQLMSIKDYSSSLRKGKQLHSKEHA